MAHPSPEFHNNISASPISSGTSPGSGNATPGAVLEACILLTGRVKHYLRKGVHPLLTRTVGFGRTGISHILLSLVLIAICGNSVAMDIAVDNDGGSPSYVETGSGWTTGSLGYNNGSFRFTQSATATATWVTSVPFSTVYNVSAIFRSGADRPSKVSYTVQHVSGTTVVGISQQGTGDIVEVPLGSYSFQAGSSSACLVQMTAPAGGSTCVADAILLRMGSPADDGPVITALVRTPAVVTSTTAVSVRAIVTDEASVTSAAVSYIVSPGGSEGMVQAFDDGAHGDVAAGDAIYGATLPPSADGTSVALFFRAWDNSGHEGCSLPRIHHVSRNPSHEIRAIWADSWGTSFRSQTEADDLISTCRAANINVVMPQVRKIGDACYNSSLEPRADNITGGATFDPLGYITQIAHDTSGGKHRLQIHAWFNMNLVASGYFLPTSHVLSLHPEYEMLKRDGSTASPRYLDPGHPGAVDHNVAVILDCLGKYDIDGCHLDFIRYPSEAGMWGYNPVSVARFNALNGRTGTPDDWDPLWRAWRRECIDLMVKKILVKAWKLKPHVVLTPATVNWGWAYDEFTSSAAYNQVFQDWPGWLQRGLVDYNALMSYSRLTDPARHQGWSARSLADENGRGSIIGIGAYLSANIQGSMDQLLYARSSGAAGLNIYDWQSEVQGSTLGETRDQFYATLKDQVFPTWVDPPSPTWKTAPTAGMFEGNVSFGGQPVDHATVRIPGYPLTETVTDGSGWYAIMDVPPGPHTVEFVKPGVGVGTRAIAASVSAAGDIVTLDASLDPSDVSDWQRY
jgi:uncharacterized lipoprotein YddW (UPF0748 family)